MLITTLFLASLAPPSALQDEPRAARLPCELRLRRPVLSPTGSSWFPSGIDAADLDGDGAPEVVTANSFSGTFTILRHVGSGVLAPVETLSIASGEAKDVVLADVTGDGRADLVGCVQFGTGTLVVFPGEGGARFGAGRTFGPDLRSASHLELVDVDADSDLDAVVSSAFGGLGDPFALVFRNEGDGTFGPPDGYAFVPTVPFTYFSFVTTGDVDGDGDADLVGTGLPFNGNVGIQLGVGDGTFQAGSVFTLVGTSALHALTLVDADRDGDLDLAAYDGSFQAPSVVLASNDGAGGFAEQLVLPMQGSSGSIESPRALAFGHLDGDAVLDFVTTHNIVPMGPCSEPEASGLQAFDAVLVDLDGDGRLDPVVATQITNGEGLVGVFLNRTRARLLRRVPRLSLSPVSVTH